jgi:hypothetical protein
LFGDSFAYGFSLLGNPVKRRVLYSPQDGPGNSGIEGAVSEKISWSCSMILFCSAGSVAASNDSKRLSACLAPKRCQLRADVSPTGFAVAVPTRSR